MSSDDEQNRRLDSVEADVKTLKTDVQEIKVNTAVVESSYKNLEAKVGTGFIDLKDDLLTARREERMERKLEREALTVQQDKDRKGNQWWWGKVFTALGTLLAILAGGGATTYYATAPNADVPTATESPLPALAPPPPTSDP